VQADGGGLPLLGLVWGEQISQITFQAATQVLQHIEADILLAHLEAMQGRFGNAEAAGKIPLGSRTTKFPKVLR
jgi:hypothetical protein